jgi:hypothetical protein
MGSDAIPLLLRSLHVLPTYLPAMVDLVVAQMYAGDRDAASVTLNRLLVLAPNHPSIADLRKLVHSRQTKKQYDKR